MSPASLSLLSPPRHLGSLPACFAYSITLMSRWNKKVSIKTKAKPKSDLDLHGAAFERSSICRSFEFGLIVCAACGFTTPFLARV